MLILGKKKGAWVFPNAPFLSFPEIRVSGLEGEGTKKGDVSRPERSEGRVTATAFMKQKIH
jgi:hypothetical protein